MWEEFKKTMKFCFCDDLEGEFGKFIARGFGIMLSLSIYYIIGHIIISLVGGLING